MLLNSQVSGDYKLSIHIDIDQYWSKSIEYLESERFSQAQFLLTTLSYDDKDPSACNLLSAHFQRLNQALESQNKELSEESLADFVITGILIDINNLPALSSIVERKSFIKKLLSELVAIQPIAKKYRFQNYKEILIGLRKLHITAVDKTKMVELINQIDLISQTQAAC